MPPFSVATVVLCVVGMTPPSASDLYVAASPAGSATTLGPGSTEQTDGRRPIELTVSAASSLTDAFKALKWEFQRRRPDVTIRLNLGGSNLLQRQIEATRGRGVDVFAPAGEAQMAALIEAGLIDEQVYGVFASNRIVLICPTGNPAGLQSFADLSDVKVKHIAIGSRGVPVGRYSTQVLRHLGMFERLEHKLVYSIHVRQVLDYVSRGETEAGLVYATDAAATSQRTQTIAWAKPQWHEPIRYPIAVLKASEHREAAAAFVRYVTTPEAAVVLSDHGFILPLDGFTKATTPPDARSADKPPAEQHLGSGALTAMKLSLIAASGAMLIVFPVGTALGALLAKRRFLGRELLDALLTLPMILPPTVTGYYLIILLGAQSPVGARLESWFGVRVVLTLVGATVASAVIALPLMVKSARAAFESVNREYELASYSLGKGKLQTWFHITLPLARNGLVAGAILSFARAIGEFGATFMLAGIIPGQTMTMPSAIFQAFTNHEDRTAQFLVLILTLFSVLVIYATNRLSARQLERTRR